MTTNEELLAKLLSAKLDALEDRMTTSERNICDKIDTKYELLRTEIRPDELWSYVTKHDRQISFWRGALGVLYILWGAAVAFLTHRRP